MITSNGHGVAPGDLIRIIVADRRWWRRLWHWLLRRPAPQRCITHRVGKATSTTLETIHG